MKASELLGLRVRDPHGAPLGTVSDIRVRRYADGHHRLDALLIGGATIGNRLGYLREDMRGPWLFRATLRPLARRARVVAWTDVERIADGIVHVTTPVHEVPTVADVERREVASS